MLIGHLPDAFRIDILHSGPLSWWQSVSYVPSFVRSHASQYRGASQWRSTSHQRRLCVFSHYILYLRTLILNRCKLKNFFDPYLPHGSVRFCKHILWRHRYAADLSINSSLVWHALALLLVANIESKYSKPSGTPYAHQTLSDSSTSSICAVRIWCGRNTIAFVCYLNDIQTEELSFLCRHCSLWSSAPLWWWQL